jgi:hypothetical protein
MELWRAVDAHNAVVDAQNGALGVLYCRPVSQIETTLTRSIKLKSLIRIHIKLRR